MAWRGCLCHPIVPPGHPATPPPLQLAVFNELEPNILCDLTERGNIFRGVLVSLKQGMSVCLSVSALFGPWMARPSTPLSCKTCIILIIEFMKYLNIPENYSNMQNKSREHECLRNFLSFFSVAQPCEDGEVKNICDTHLDCIPENRCQTCECKFNFWFCSGGCNISEYIRNISGQPVPTSANQCQATNATPISLPCIVQCGADKLEFFLQ